MPLSEHEQRIFDEIEQNLSEDPQFASAVRAYDPTRVTRKKLIASALISLLGLGVVIGGVIAGSGELWITLTGAIIMFGGLVFALWTQRKGSTGKLSVVDTDGNRRPAPKPSKGPKPDGFTTRMEERWRRRREDGGMF
ncbi:DUF3040 domain-containing protein [Haloglycomyces albus]|uniref:DUF3040 domain-containing protein n=1 Tax=Haloglycomyces albus TaxID=526067 RepID=UPI00046CD9B2|nr:DUF3040 domain-containing protein [Haloglycomyces albus]